MNASREPFSEQFESRRIIELNCAAQVGTAAREMRLVGRSYLSSFHEFVSATHGSGFRRPDFGLVNQKARNCPLFRNCPKKRIIKRASGDGFVCRNCGATNSKGRIPSFVHSNWRFPAPYLPNNAHSGGTSLSPFCETKARRSR